MLKQRVLTALALLALIVPAIFVSSSWAWPLLSLVFCSAATWEWGRMVNANRIAIRSAILMFLLGLCALSLEAGLLGKISLVLAVLSCVFWVFFAPFRLKRLDARGGRWPLAFMLVFAAWLSLVQIHQLGPWVLISAMAIVWVADIGAYFVGRAVGKRKLAPVISPGKSWEGVWGGMFFVVVGGLTAAASPALATILPARLVTQVGPLVAALVLAVLAAWSVIGDLHESLLKRQASVKDSSALLPGHGGVLDRIDALLPTMPMVYLLHYGLGATWKY